MYKMAIMLIMFAYCLSPTISTGAITRGDKNIEELFSKVRSEGTVRIIVGLTVDFHPEGELPSPEAIKKQREAIAQAQAGFLERLSSFQVTNVRTYISIPYIAMEVDEEALMAIVDDSMVMSIQENVEDRPTSH